LFNVKYVYYFEGSLSNEAAVAMAKDVRIKMDFFQKQIQLLDQMKLQSMIILVPAIIEL